MRSLKTMIILIGIAGYSLDNTAQINTLKFEHFTTNEGLSQSTVKCIHQDKLGFIWFGTIKGLNRFDGLEFTTYSHHPRDSGSLTNSHITALLEDSKGDFWIGTPDGLNRFNRSLNNFERFVHMDKDINSLPNNYIHDLTEDSKGNLWIATRGGISKYHRETNHFENFSYETHRQNGMVSNNIRCIYEDRDQNLWVGYFFLDGLQKFDPLTTTFTHVLFDQSELESETDIPTPLNVTIRDIFEDSKGNFWLGTDDYGLILFDKTRNNYLAFNKNAPTPGAINATTVWDIDEDDSGNLLIATEGGGLNVLNLENFNQQNPQFAHYQVEPLNAYSINDNFLLSLYKDRDGLIWIGSKDSGINKIDKGIQKFTHYQSNQLAGNNLSNKDVLAILQDHVGSLWVGTADGLNRIDAERINIEYFYEDPEINISLAGNHIYSIYQDQNLDIWIGTNEGLNKLALDNTLSPAFSSYRPDITNPSVLSQKRIHCMLEDTESNFWLGTPGGLYLMDRENETFRLFYNAKNEAANRIICLFQDKKDRVWVGTEHGLYQFKSISNQFIPYLQEDNNPVSISNDFIHCLYEDNNGNLWIGTSEGLNKILENNGTISFETYGIIDGFPDNTIYAIKGDRKGNLWLSTSAGLTRFNPSTKTIKNFTDKDGLQKGEYNSNASYKNWKGELFFGGTDGLNIFLPEKLPFNQKKPPVVLTNFVINYKPVDIRPMGQLEKHISVADKVTLFPGDNKSFSFEFTALNYTQSKKNAYAYKLENYDDTWQYPNNQNIAFYTNIDPGKYIFRVKAANNDGVWNEEGVSVDVHIQPTFIQTWYFKVALLIGSIGIGYLIYLNRVHSLRQRSTTLEKMVKERTEQVQKQNKQLESTVKTLKETQEQLVVSEKMASLGQLTAGIAHEINNPINFISSNVQALKMDFRDLQEVLKKVKELEKSEEPQTLTNDLIHLCQSLDFDLLEKEIGELLAGIERGTERTVNIVSSLRTFSRNATDNFSLAQIHEGIDSTLTILNSQLNDHITIEKNYGNLPPVRCQISRLNQVFLNIINNSIQAIQAKSNGNIQGGLIKITTKKMSTKVLISIKDNGKGMSETTRKRIFEPFFTTKDIGEGTGLGLSISYGIIEQHNGKIEVFTEPGKGTEFLIHLPVAGK